MLVKTNKRIIILIFVRFSTFVEVYRQHNPYQQMEKNRIKYKLHNKEKSNAGTQDNKMHRNTTHAWTVCMRCVSVRFV